MIGYVVLLLLAIVLLKFVSEFDYQLRMDKIEYAVKWQEDFKSEKWERLSLNPQSEKVTIKVPPIDTTSGYIDIITLVKSGEGGDNMITLRDAEKVLSKKIVEFTKSDTIRFKSHTEESQELISLKDTMYLDFEVLVRDSSLLKSKYAFEVIDIKLFQLKKQKPIF